jgi:D-alanyl-D-alanine carboxypeptidase (penicillin-binding protein 5/6)
LTSAAAVIWTQTLIRKVRFDRRHDWSRSMPTRYCLAATLTCLLSLASFAAQTAAREPADALTGAPYVTAKAWAIADGKTGRLLWSFNEAEPRAIASTSKIMTAWVVLQLTKSDPSLLDQVVTFSERADKTNGSTSDIHANEHLTVRELLYGLLLPSGNDAAVALAEHFGGHFRDKEKSAPKENSTADENLAAFVAQMNQTAKQLGMASAEYIDPHGLGANRVSAADLLKLAHAAMQDETFRHYVNTPRHSTAVEAADGSKRDINWSNTNKLLATDGYDGIKTGTTSRAGACLVSSCHRGDDHLIAVVLGATSSDARYTDTRNLLRWAWIQRGHQESSTSAPAR